MNYATKRVLTTKKISSSSFSNTNIDQEINSYLDCGWIILESWKTKIYVENEAEDCIHFLLGWTTSTVIEEPEYPPDPNFLGVK